MNRSICTLITVIDKIVHRVVVMFLTKQGKAPHIIMQEIPIYGDHCSKRTMIYKWHALFKPGRQSIEDGPRPGRPVETTSPEILEKIEKLILKEKVLAEIVKVTPLTVLTIL
ncbi:Putative uncharacterized protein FLJ37770 [Eumeta japonica]|uniref:Mos1 transposase HTH domain-containing protein n=1 Tax=Eumeta variegata TaxID=151549 RepID=A0A4C1TSK8_EUMVA|nr:Putative uncharacterized protein FLJ37770 [Eumeta japonica]